MPSDLTVSGVSQVGLEPATATAAPVTSTTPAATQEVVAPAKMLPNPQFQIDLALNIVVMEVYSGEGQQVQSYPAERVLEAYRSGELPLPGESGGGGGGGGAAQGGQAGSTAQPAQPAQTPQPVQPASTAQDTVQAVAAAGATTAPATTSSGFTGDITA